MDGQDGKDGVEVLGVGSLVASRGGSDGLWTPCVMSERKSPLSLWTRDEGEGGQGTEFPAYQGNVRRIKECLNTTHHSSRLCCKSNNPKLVLRDAGAASAINNNLG